jgi:hypothetical protein
LAVRETGGGAVIVATCPARGRLRVISLTNSARELT